MAGEAPCELGSKASTRSARSSPTVRCGHTGTPGRAGRRLRCQPGTPEFQASYNEVVSKKVAPPSGVLMALLFRFQDSAEFQTGISERTRRDYIKQIKRIERAFGDFPIKAFADLRSRSDIPRMARSAGTDVIAASRLRLWHIGAHPVVGAQSRIDREEPVRQGRQALSRQPHSQDLG